MALQAVRDSHGLMEVVTDENILEVQALLAKVEGLFVEPASAASIAGLKKLIEQKIIEKDEVVTCIVTGHGLKDPNIVKTQFQRPIQVSKNLTGIIDKLGLQKTHLEVIR
jgi:threonine synthase